MAWEDEPKARYDLASLQEELRYQFSTGCSPSTAITRCSVTRKQHALPAKRIQNVG